MHLVQLIDEFIIDCRVRSPSDATIARAYEPALRDISDWLDNPSLEDITTDDVRRYFVDLGTTSQAASRRAASDAVVLIWQAWYNVW